MSPTGKLYPICAPTPANASETPAECTYTRENSTDCEETLLATADEVIE